MNAGNLDLRLQIATAAGALRAEQAWTEGGWRKAPAQCPICMSLINGASTQDMMTILDAWNAAYRARCRQFEDAALAA